MSVHSFLHQIPAVTATAELPFYPLSARDVFSDPETWDDECDDCGACAEYQRLDRDSRQWLGQAETDWCQGCGAEYEHWHAENKLPLSDWSVLSLLHMARDVEMAYLDIACPMTDEQVANNRSYLKRLIAAMASVCHDHIAYRSVEDVARQRWDDLADEAAQVLDIMSPGMGRTFFAGATELDFSESDLANFIDRQKAVLAMLESGRVMVPAA